MKIHQPQLGRYFEDFNIGDLFKHWPGRTISETDNTWFTLLTMNTHPMHFDAEYAKHSEFGRCIICSPLTLAVLVLEKSSPREGSALARAAIEVPGIDVSVVVEPRVGATRGIARDLRSHPARRRPKACCLGCGPGPTCWRTDRPPPGPLPGYPGPTPVPRGRRGRS